MKKLNILILFDAPTQSNSLDETRCFLKSPDWRDEKDVFLAVKRLGHQPIPFAICDDLDHFHHQMHHYSPDFVFFLCEAFAGRRDLESQMVGYLELLGVPYSGASSSMLQICKDKALVKTILRQNDVLVPDFKVIRSNLNLDAIELKFPLICKPLNRDASEGISYASIVKNLNQLEKRVGYLRNKFVEDVICEEYIEGNEIYSGFLVGQKIEIFHPIVMQFPVNRPQIVTYKVKWDDNFRKQNHIRTRKANMSEFEISRIKKQTQKVVQALNFTGYGRIDWRYTEGRDLYCLEINPNPAIAKEDDFAKGARYSGLAYDQLIQKIIANGFKRYAESNYKKGS